MILLLPAIFLATLASGQPHGYQYQLPKEYNSYSQYRDGSYSQMEPFRRFLRKYISSYKPTLSGTRNHPYQYMNHPMANVPVSDFKNEIPNQYMYIPRRKDIDNEHSDWEKYMENAVYPPVHNDWEKYMIGGGDFFKEHEDHVHHEDNEYNDDGEQLPYTVVEEYQNYEKRHYPSATFICNRTSVDTAADPLAGLEQMNPFDVMTSRRYQKTPKSQMFMELFRYIQGVNKNQEEIEMTRPVLLFHNVTKETTIGNYEDQQMCFYLPSKYQENHQHPEQGEEPQGRHAAVPPPEPLDNARVYVYTRPAMQVFVRRFGGFALTHQTWEDQREILEEDLLGKKYNPSQYFTATYDNPWKLTEKRNEVWIQCLEPFETLPAELVDNKLRKAPGGRKVPKGKLPPQPYKTKPKSKQGTVQG